MDFNQFNELINGKKEEKNMNKETLKELIENGEMDEFLRKLVDQKIEEFRKSYDELDKILYAEYKDAVNKGIYLLGFFEQVNDIDAIIQFITSIARGYVNELYNKGNIDLSFADKFNIETMYNIVKETGKHGFLEATLYSLLNGAA